MDWFIVFGLFATTALVIASYCMGSWAAMRYWQEEVQAAHQYEVEAEEALRIMRIAQESSIALAHDKLRLWQHVQRLWDERDAEIRWADAWKAASADIDAERLAALARCADLEHELSRLQAVVCEEDYKSIGRVLGGPSTVAAEAKAFIEQASAEVQEEAARLAAADEARATKVLDLAKRAAHHFTSDTITPRTEPLSDEELDALVQDDMDAMRDWRETSDQLDGPEKGGDQ